MKKNQINQNYNIINNQLNQENNIQNIQIKTASNIYETQVKHLQEQEIKENDLENEMCQQDLKRINENSNNIKNSYQSRRNNLKNQIQAIQDEIFTLKNLEKTADPGGVEVITEKKSSCFGLKSKNSTHQIYRPNQKIAISQTISIRENTLRDLLKEQRILDNEEKNCVITIENNIEKLRNVSNQNKHQNSNKFETRQNNLQNSINEMNEKTAKRHEERSNQLMKEFKDVQNQLHYQFQEKNSNLIKNFGDVQSKAHEQKNQAITLLNKQLKDHHEKIASEYKIKNDKLFENFEATRKDVIVTCNNRLEYENNKLKMIELNEKNVEEMKIKLHLNLENSMKKKKLKENKKLKKLNID